MRMPLGTQKQWKNGSLIFGFLSVTFHLIFLYQSCLFSFDVSIAFASFLFIVCVCVWSDFKNNSKKKASRIYKATRGTGGSPASNMKLSDLEQRALSIIGTQASTGIIEIPEVGLEDEVIEPPSECPNNSQIHEQETFSFAEDWNRPGTSRQPPLIHPPMHVPSTSEIELGLVGSGAPEAGGPATDPRVPLETALHIASSAPPAASTEAPSTLPPTSARRRIRQSHTLAPHTSSAAQRSRPIIPYPQKDSHPNTVRTGTAGFCQI